MGRYLDLATRALRASPPDEINEINEKRLDPYQNLARAALAQTCRPDYPGDMIPWLEKHHPNLYHELTSVLPDDIHRLWTEHAPLTEFQEILDLWLEAHRTACELRVKDVASVRAEAD